MEIEGANLYEVNKQLSSQEKILTESRRNMKKNQIKLWFRDEVNHINHYAMLLCHELRDYTVFNVLTSPGDAAEAVLECLDNRGDIVSIDRTEDKAAWEIWVRINEEDYCYYLFNYSAAVIEC